MIELRPVSGGVLLHLHAQPRARRNGIVGERDGALRVAVTAAPDKGKANDAIAALLAEAFHCPKSAVRLVSGKTSRRKTFILDGLDAKTAKSRAAELLEGAN